MSELHRLAGLPEELLQDIIQRLTKPDLFALSLTSKWCYQAATPLIWKEVELVDCSTSREDGRDDHDDTAIIRKLLLLAR